MLFYFILFYFFFPKSQIHGRLKCQKNLEHLELLEYFRRRKEKMKRKQTF